MGRGSSGIPGPMLFLLLLLLLLLLPWLSVGSFQYRLPGWVDFHHLSERWRNLHRHFTPNKGKLQQAARSQGDWPQQSRAANKNSCQSEYDIYFVLDMSGSVDGNWMDIYNLVDGLVKRFQNPKVRVSFILFSTTGKTIMKLTSDKKLIREGLQKLQNVVPEGATHMQAGLRMAYYQILEATNAGKKPVQSLILTLTDGTLDDIPFEEAKEEAEKCRKLGATVYGLGIKDYRREQLDEIANSKNHVFAVERFEDLKKIIDPLTKKSCVEITRLEASSYCAGENYMLLVIGRGFTNAKKKEDVICRYNFNATEFFDRGATSVTGGTIKCPGVKIKKPGQQVLVQISLDNGASFVDKTAKITSKQCHRSPIIVPKILPVIPLYVAGAGAGLLVLLLPFCCCQRCRTRTIKKKEPKQVPCVQRPIVVFPYCKCRNKRIKQMEENLDPFCHFTKGCDHMPLICEPKNKVSKGHEMLPVG
ncbi:anthrax toxin receptor-like isoform X2 [Erinaceus europaeus]|uniref:Anthrax toxin receptor-like isoform X2 n=1 Tax=Erinaceus europaeus TaxID=9365 RepID=A0ABM3XEA2_ERIEU|nr:anthrax toxin receptor-like isoform X2 [Erinaceus europaeus]